MESIRKHLDPCLKPSNLACAFFFTGLGTIARAIYGVATREWNAASDHLAWQITLAGSSTLRADELFHYPHEGADPLIAVLAIVFSQLALPGLAAATLTVETLSRFLQILIAFRLFGRSTALWFGCWTVLAVPGLLPWSVVGFGLHALSSFWPFLLILVLGGVLEQHQTWLGVGACLGLALIWSLDSLVLVPVAGAAFLPLLFRTPALGLKALMTVFITASLVVLPYTLLTAFLDTGFHLEPHGLLWIRGVEHELLDLLTWWQRFETTLTHALPGATVLPGTVADLDTTRMAWFLAVYFGILLALLKPSRPVWLAVAAITCHLIVYSGSPYWFDKRDHDLHYSFGLYRHLYYIMPLAVALGFHGFMNSKRKFIPLAAIVVLVSVSSGVRLQIRHETHAPQYDAVGWTLGRKFGHDPRRLEGFVQFVPPSHSDDLVRGFGWGISETVLALSQPSLMQADHARVARIESIIKGFRVQNQKLVAEGVERFLRSDEQLPAARRALALSSISRILRK